MPTREGASLWHRVAVGAINCRSFQVMVVLPLFVNWTQLGKILEKIYQRLAFVSASSKALLIPKESARQWHLTSMED